MRKTLTEFRGDSASGLGVLAEQISRDIIQYTTVSSCSRIVRALYYIIIVRRIFQKERKRIGSSQGSDEKSATVTMKLLTDLTLRSSNNNDKSQHATSTLLYMLHSHNNKFRTCLELRLSLMHQTELCIVYKQICYT